MTGQLIQQMLLQMTLKNITTIKKSYHYHKKVFHRLPILFSTMLYSTMVVAHYLDFDRSCAPMQRQVYQMVDFYASEVFANPTFGTSTLTVCALLFLDIQNP